MGWTLSSPPPPSDLTLEDALEIANKHLEETRKTKNKPAQALVFSDYAKSMLKYAGKIFIAKKIKDPILSEGIAKAYYEHGDLLAELGRHDDARKSRSEAEKWRHVHAASQQAGSFRSGTPISPTHRLLFPPAVSIAAPGVAMAMRERIVGSDIAYTNPQSHTQQTIQKVAQKVAQTESKNHIPSSSQDTITTPQKIFDQNVAPPVIKYALPEAGERITSTPQLAYCLSLISPSLASIENLDENAHDWLQAKVNELDEQERLRAMTSDLVRTFVRDELKKPDVTAEVVSLTAVLEQDDFQLLLGAFVDTIDKRILLEVHILSGLAQIIRNSKQGYMIADDLVRILQLLNSRLGTTHQQSKYVYLLAQTISQVLDSMVDSQVEGLSREQLHETFSDYLEWLQKSPDPYLTYQAAYTYQALLYIPDDESILQRYMRRTGKVIQGISGVVNAVMALDFNGFIDELRSIQNGLTDTRKATELVGNTHEDIQALAESGQGLVENFKEGFSFNRKSSWYPALRAVNPAWDIKVHKSAISFLADLYTNDSMWDCQTYIKSWILNLLYQIAQSLQGIAADDAQKILHELQAGGSTDEGVLHEGAETYQVKLDSMIFIPPPQESPLLNLVQNNTVDVETPLHQLKMERLFDRSGDVYISPRAKSSLRATKAFDLTSKAQEFLQSDKKVLLLLGDSGSGKSTFNRVLEIGLWYNYKKGGRIPLFIHLPTIDEPEHNLIAKYLQEANFTDVQIRELKTHREFVLICDGYDECRQTKNLYTSNKLNQPGEWQVQMVISCRTEYNGIGYKNNFRPNDIDDSDSDLFQEAIIAPFNKGQIQAYIDQYVNLAEPPWGYIDYLGALEEIPNLQDLVKDPFLLKLALEVLPSLVDAKKDFSATRITYVKLYDEFVAQWIERSKVRLSVMELSPRDKVDLEMLSKSGFRKRAMGYLKEFVSAIYEKQDGFPVVNYLERRDQRTWKAPLFSSEGGRQLLRESIPLARYGNHYRFLHKSLLEHGLSLAIFDPNDHEEGIESTLPQSLHRETSSTGNFDILSPSGKATRAIEQRLLTSPLGSISLLDQRSVILFLSQRVEHHRTFKDELWAIIERSKTDKRAQIAASNAITILAKAKVQFSGMDLRAIKISGADLSYSVFDSAQLDDSDLRGVNFMHASLQGASLNGAQMGGVQFGMLPFLREESRAEICVCSPNGKTYAVGLWSGDISLYDTHDTSKWRFIGQLTGHSKKINCLVFSSTSNRILTGSSDTTVRLWDADNSQCIRTFEGCDNEVVSVAYSPKGDRVASGSGDKTIRVWNVDTDDYVYVLEGHKGSITSIAFSPEGDRIASGSRDKTVKLWDIETRSCIHTLQGHSHYVTSIVYSPKGDHIASGSWDKTVRLWEVETGDCVQTLQGHNCEITSVAYSPEGDQVASGGYDRTVRLWDIKSKECLLTISGFIRTVNSLAWGGNTHDQCLVTGCQDRSVSRRRVCREEGEYKATLSWNSSQEELAVSGASFINVQGLSRENWRLVSQGGALIPPPPE
ncbi:hypothetical protein BGZ80_000081 [Entomortierella chlamydospora]|uniref:Arm-like repeat domain-containing protein n=1 Tax=Entomortierella chlamydospora TaxID=101097 RepID=A0A9P6N3Q3_9FUNG|nr:hypothetical protein BGZ80_000081 [Entomortierella chlamydospora]